MTIDPTIKTAWVKALRSGDYTQTTENLQDENGFCCLGVLCELAVEAGIVQRESEPNLFGEISYGPAGTHPHSGGWSDAVLPQVVMDWVGFRAGNNLGEFDAPDDFEYSTALTELNDNGHDFDFIADVIEKHL